MGSLALTEDHEGTMTQVTRARTRNTFGGMLIDLFALAAIVAAIPIGILLLGAPLALAIKGVLALARWLTG